MNREILFKAKRKDWRDLPKEQWWIEGLPTRMWRELYIQDSEDENTAYKIDPDTLCQYTGLTDKNGKKIWENDILRRDGYWDIRIEFENGAFMVRNADKVQYINRVTCTPISTFNIKAYEVIGNIFDNADLLEVVLCQDLVQVKMRFSSS